MDSIFFLPVLLALQCSASAPRFSYIFFCHLILASSNSCIVCSLPALHPLFSPLWHGFCQTRREIWLGKLLGGQDHYFINYCFNLHTFVSFIVPFCHSKSLQDLKTNSVFLFYVCPREMCLWLSSALLKPVVNQKQLIKEVTGGCSPHLPHRPHYQPECIFWVHTLPSSRPSKNQVSLLQDG